MVRFYCINTFLIYLFMVNTWKKTKVHSELKLLNLKSCAFSAAQLRGTLSGPTPRLKILYSEHWSQCTLECPYIEVSAAVCQYNKRYKRSSCRPVELFDRFVWNEINTQSQSKHLNSKGCHDFICVLILCIVKPHGYTHALSTSIQRLTFVSSFQSSGCWSRPVCLKFNRSLCSALASQPFVGFSLHEKFTNSYNFYSSN